MRSLYLFVVIVILVKCFAIEVRQEGAKINICNTKYLVECYGKTLRLRRGEPYKSNFTTITRHTWGNNVTMRVDLDGGIKVTLVNSKLCDLEKIDWVFEYIKTYGHIDGRCPLKPGQYGFYDLEFPPKNFPVKIMNLVNKNFQTKFYLLVTDTKEIILESSTIFRIIT